MKLSVPVLTLFLVLNNAFPNSGCNEQNWAYTKESSKIQRDDNVVKTYVHWNILKNSSERQFRFTQALPVHRCLHELSNCTDPTAIFASSLDHNVSMEVCTKVADSCQKVRVTFKEDISCHCVHFEDGFDDIESGPAREDIGQPPNGIKFEFLEQCGGSS